MNETLTAGAAIDSLRAAIEEEHRFKTALQGYNKTEVSDYLKSLNESFSKAIELAEKENKRLAEENAELLGKAETLEQEKAEARSDERRRREAELNMQEGLLSELRAANLRLTEENRRQQTEIAALEAKLAEARSRVSEGGTALSTLNATLESLLQTKVRECEDTVKAWQKEFQDVIDLLDRQVSGDAEKEG